MPMLGTGGSYLGFVTGNLTNLKVPCALNAMEAAKVRPGSEEGEVISTIAIASSSIVTTLVIALGVFGLGFLRPVLESPALKPAFDNILPALFGALGVVFISKNPKLAAAPLAFMVVLFLLAPGLSSSVGVLVPVGRTDRHRRGAHHVQARHAGRRSCRWEGGAAMTAVWILIIAVAAFLAVIVARACMFKPVSDKKVEADSFSVDTKSATEHLGRWSVSKP